MSRMPVSDAVAPAILAWLGEGHDGDRRLERGLAALSRPIGASGLRRAIARLARLRSGSVQVETHKVAELARLLANPAVTLCLLPREGNWVPLVRDGERWHWRDESGCLMPFVSLGEDGKKGLAVIARMVAVPLRSSLFRGRLPELAVAGLLINACGLLLPLFSSLVYNKVITSGHLATLWALALGMLLFVGLEVVLRSARSFTIEQLAVHADVGAEDGLATRLLDGEAHRNPGLGSLLSRYRDHASARDALLGQYVTTAVDLPFVIIYLLAILFIAGPVLLVPAVAGAFMLVGHVALHAKAHRLEAENARLSVERFTLLGELTGASDAWQASPLRGPLEKRWYSAVQAGALGRAHARFWRTAAQTTTGLWVTLSSVFVLVAGVYLVEAHQLNVGGLIASSLLSLRAMGLMASVVGLLSGWKHLKEARNALERALPQASDRAVVPLSHPKGELVARQLGWSYPGRRPLFDAFDLRIRPGEKIALVGAAGSGKSTLLRCLAGLIHPRDGEVLIDGIAVDAIGVEDRQRWLAYKRQEPAIFAGTLFDNLGADAVDRQRLHEVAAMLGLGLDDARGVLSLDRRLVSGGGNLSGGQRQLVELTRTLARQAAIFLIDEPTAGLDAEAEKNVVRALQVFAGPATVVMATHSARVIGIADRVILLDQGRIVQDIPASRLVGASNDAQATTRIVPKAV